jgi:hypothetical protein
MAKITVSRIFELSKYLSTKSGQELKDALTYMADFAEVTLRNLRNGLTFQDNIDCEIKTVTLRTNTEATISVASRKRAVAVLVRRVVNDQYYIVEKFGWKFDTSGNIVLTAVFSGSPASTLDISVEILILFG